MSKLNPVWRKSLRAKPRITAIMVAFAAVLGWSILSGGSAYASGTNCAAGYEGLSNICMHIDGSSNIVADAIGSAQVTSSNGIGEYSQNNQWVYYIGHVQVVNPVGTTLCNSNSVTLTYGAAMSCESPYQGATYTGNYCTILWVYNGEYHNYGEECLNVFKS